ncbi:two-component system sensor histidine kinase [Bifidobacterium cebidarum]|uniref:histidine kinase n=2 Tax=Bifidobacterium cebidarum TaxID=2650773 RepID=A0A6I1GFH5_9BIFI|nr:two-component system sensor histidine kinase [Bifidobacterium cebidarum]
MGLIANVRMQLTKLGGKTYQTLLFDTLLAVVLLVLGSFMATSTDPGTTPGLLFRSSSLATVLWNVPSIVPLALRRTHPEAAAWIFVGLTVLHLIVGPTIIYSDFLALIMLYSVLVYGNPHHSARFVMASLAVSLLTGTVWGVTFNIGPLFGTAAGPNIAWTSWLPTATTLSVCPATGLTTPNASSCSMKMLEDSLMMTVVIAICAISVIIMALWQRARHATLAAMRERNAAIAARDAEETRIAALAERARIARDMHDVVAHTLSTIIVQADGGRYAGAHDINLARSTMGTIRHEAQRAQHDMQRLFSVFGTQAGSTSIAYSNMPSLWHGAANVSRTVTGPAHPERLSAQASEAVFRLVQEALTNARKYAGTGAHVFINEHWLETALNVTITDDGLGAEAMRDGHQPGYGLIGMHERIEALGGTVSAGPQLQQGFAVSASIPLSPMSESNQAPTFAVHSTSITGNNSHPDNPAQSILPIWTRITDAAKHTLRSWVASISVVFQPKHFEQGESVHRFNWIGRLSQWTERHYLLIDILVAAILVLLFNSSTYNDLRLLANDGIHWLLPNRALTTVLTIALLAPVAFRRRFPESSALAMAIMSFIQLLLPASIMPSNALAVNVFALVSVYSAVLYGREHAWRWVSMTLVVDSWVFGIKIAAGWNGTSLWGTTAQLVIPGRDSWTAWRIILSGLMPGGMVMMAGFACIAAARWTRSRGANALVLQQREEALRAEQERQKVLAANLERERIGAAMQTEVLATLESVISQTDEGLIMLSSSPEPNSEQIASSFAAIGARGRTALAHMRELLAVLRRTGFSDDTGNAYSLKPPLQPAQSLEQQLATIRH